MKTFTDPSDGHEVVVSDRVTRTVAEILDELDEDLDDEFVVPYVDRARHLVCLPYSVENLHRVAEELEINRCWFDGDHYDVPARRKAEIEARDDVVVVSSKEIVRIIRSAKGR